MVLIVCGIIALLAIIIVFVNYDFFVGMHEVSQKLNGCTAGDACNKLWDYFTTPLYQEHAGSLIATALLIVFLALALYVGYKKK